MQLRNQVEWALHCALVLSGLPQGKVVGTKKLAEFHGVPKEYLSKALQALASAEIITGTLGPTGGYCLAKDPKKITMLDIVEAVEGRKVTFECTEIRTKNPCLVSKKMNGICSIAKVMYRADEAWREELRSVTLAELGRELATQVPAAQLQKNLEWLLP